MSDQPMPPPTTQAVPIPLAPAQGGQSYGSSPSYTNMPSGIVAPGITGPVEPPKGKQNLLPWIVVAVLAVLLLAVVTALAFQTSQVSKARDEATATAATLTQVQEDLDDAKREVTDATGKASAAEIRADKIEECARGLWSTLDSAVDEDWITAYGELSEVKAVCESSLGGGGSL